MWDNTADNHFETVLFAECARIQQFTSKPYMSSNSTESIVILIASQAGRPRSKID
jgi:hypothetical protein